MATITITDNRSKGYCPSHAGIDWIVGLVIAIRENNPSDNSIEYLRDLIFNEKEKLFECAFENAQLFPDCTPCFIAAGMQDDS